MFEIQTESGERYSISLTKSYIFFTGPCGVCGELLRPISLEIGKKLELEILEFGSNHPYFFTSKSNVTECKFTP